MKQYKDYKKCMLVAIKDIRTILKKNKQILKNIIEANLTKKPVFKQEYFEKVEEMKREIIEDLKAIKAYSISYDFEIKKRKLLEGDSRNDYPKQIQLYCDYLIKEIQNILNLRTIKKIIDYLYIIEAKTRMLLNF